MVKMINLDWPTGRWVKTYVSDDSALWKRLGFEARAVLAMLWRKMDQTGVVRVSTESAEERDEDVAALLCGAPVPFVHAGLEELLRRKVLVQKEGCLRCPEFVEAQEARTVAAQRKQESRAARRAAPPVPCAADSPELSETVPDSPGHVTSRVEEKRGEETRSELPPPPKGAGEVGGQVNGVEALVAIREAAKERLSFGRLAATPTGLPAGDGKGSEGAWIRAWREQGQGYTLADCAKLGAWLAAGGWGHLPTVPVAHLTSNLTEALQSALGWDGSPLGKARASPGGGGVSKPPPMVRP